MKKITSAAFTFQLVHMQMRSQCNSIIIFHVTIPSTWNVYEPWHDKTNKKSVRPAKTQISLGIRLVWSVFAMRSMGS